MAFQKIFSVVLVVMFLFFALASVAQAFTIMQDLPTTTDDDGNEHINPKNLCAFTIILSNIKNLALVIGGPITVLIIIVGGIMMTVSAGNEQIRGQGKKAVVGGIIGLVIIVLAWVIVGAVMTAIYGTDQGNFWWTVPQCET